MDTNNNKDYLRTHLKNHIQFDSEEPQYTNNSFQKPKLKMTQLVIKYSGGYIKNEKQAIHVLLVFVIVSIIIVYIFLTGNRGYSAEIKAPPGQKLIYPENAPPRLEV